MGVGGDPQIVEKPRFFNEKRNAGIRALRTRIPCLAGIHFSPETKAFLPEKCSFAVHAAKSD